MATPQTKPLEFPAYFDPAAEMTGRELVQAFIPNAHFKNPAGQRSFSTYFGLDVQVPTGHAAPIGRLTLSSFSDLKTLLLDMKEHGNVAVNARMSRQDGNKRLWRLDNIKYTPPENAEREVVQLNPEDKSGRILLGLLRQAFVGEKREIFTPRHLKVIRYAFGMAARASMNPDVKIAPDMLSPENILGTAPVPLAPWEKKITARRLQIIQNQTKSVRHTS